MWGLEEGSSWGRGVVESVRGVQRNAFIESIRERRAAARFP
jgi:hypothetical protein